MDTASWLTTGVKGMEDTALLRYFAGDQSITLTKTGTTFARCEALQDHYALVLVLGNGH